MVTEHPEQPAQADSEEGARKGFVCGRCNMYSSTAATFSKGTSSSSTSHSLRCRFHLSGTHLWLEL